MNSNQDSPVRSRRQPLRRRVLAALGSYAFRFRLFVLVVVTFFWTLVALGFYYYTSTDSKARAYQRVDSEVQRLVALEKEQGMAALAADLDTLNYSFNLNTYYSILEDSERQYLAGTLKQWPDGVDNSGEMQFFSLDLPSRLMPDKPLREMFGKVHVFESGQRLLISNSSELFLVTRGFLSEIATAVAMVGIPLGVVLSLVSVVLIQGQMDAFNRSIRRIMVGDLTERIPIGPSTVESREMAQNLNAMLDRINLLMDDVRRVSDNIAHDLNTPLSRLRNNISQLLLDSHSDQHDEGDPRLQQILDECNSILAMFNSLLRVAKIESGSSQMDEQTLNLATVITDVVELYEPLAMDNGISLKMIIDTSCQAHGDRNLIFQAVANVVDNAIKYSEPDGEITIRVQKSIAREPIESLQPSALSRLYEAANDETDETVEYNNFSSIVISDGGRGIQKNNHAKIFQRFYREETSRSIKPGSGLGLSMVMAVMRIHNAGIYLGDNGPGLRISLVFPSNAESRKG